MGLGSKGTKETKRGQRRLMEQVTAGESQLQPYRDAGLNALNVYQSALGLNQQQPDGPQLGGFKPGAGLTGRPLPGSQTGDNPIANYLTNNPMYEFARDEALKGTERAMAARGYNRSGNVLDALTRTAGGIATQYGDNYLNRLAGLGDMGFQGSAQTAGNRLAAGQGMANLWGQTGGRAAQAGMFAASALSNVVSGGVENALLSKYLKPQGGPQTYYNPRYMNQYGY